VTEPPVFQPFYRTALLDLPRLLTNLDSVAWEPFYENVEIHRLYGDGLSGPCAAVLRFAPGGRIPHHEHIGYEHLIMLSGSQRDEQGEIIEGTLAIHPPGTSHGVVSDTGCVVLAIYERPVRMNDD
jgi:anti-sigma factor ChrR (cupin superfamily)